VAVYKECGSAVAPHLFASEGWLNAILTVAKGKADSAEKKSDRTHYSGNMTSNLAKQQALRARCIHPSRAFVEFTNPEALQSAVQRFEQQVQWHPDRLALKTRRHTYTYSELNAIANRVAHALVELRGGRTETVALLFENGAPFVVASLAVLKTGKIQVPLDSTFPPARLSYMLEQSEAAVVVTDSCNFALAKELGAVSLIS